jgi:hypothetical protein
MWKRPQVYDLRNPEESGGGKMNQSAVVNFTPQYRYDRIMGYAAENNAIIPAQGSQSHILLTALFDGEKLTVSYALEKYGVYALSQRMGELIRFGWPVKKVWKTVRSGKRVMEYFL